MTDCKEQPKGHTQTRRGQKALDALTKAFQLCLPPPADARARVWTLCTRLTRPSSLRIKLKTRRGGIRKQME